jgi:hypothetical protein
LEISKVSLIMQQNRYWATGDTTGFLALAPDVSSILDKAVASFLKDGLHVGWFGWDDRVGNGFCGACNQEVQLAFAALVIRACRDFSVSLRHAGDATNATRYNSTASELSRRLRTRPAATGEEFYDDYGSPPATSPSIFFVARLATLPLCARGRISTSIGSSKPRETSVSWTTPPLLFVCAGAHRQ